MREIWKYVPGFNRKYKVSNMGNIYTMRYDRIMSCFDDGFGYISVRLSKNGHTRTYKVHRIVLLTFTGPNKLDVNHKNCIKNDNRLENLEYCTKSENMKHRYKNLKIKNAGLPVLVHQYDLTGDYIRTWDSMRKASIALGIGRGLISIVCSGKRPTGGGFIRKKSKS